MGIEWSIGWKVVLSAWLAVAAALDLKTRRVPHWIAWPLLLGAVVVRAWEGAWTLPVLLVGLALVEVASGGWQLPVAALLVGLVAAASGGAARFTALWWGALYALRVLHVLGGADMRIFMALVALFPDGRMVAALWGGLALVSTAWLLVQYRRHALVPLAQAGQGLLAGRYPSQEALSSQGRPTTPGLALGALVYLWLIT